MAAVLNLPVVFVCVNNGYAVTTRADYSIKAESIAARAAAYGIEGVKADGTNVVEAYETVKKAADKARAGGGPTLVELTAYRRNGHFVGELTNYRDKEEERYWKEERDPIINHGKWLVENGICEQKDLDDMMARAQGVIDDANEFAINSPQADWQEFVDDVYYTA